MSGYNLALMNIDLSIFLFSASFSAFNKISERIFKFLMNMGTEKSYIIEGINIILFKILIIIYTNLNHS
jgi:hypothetical protein